MKAVTLLMLLCGIIAVTGLSYGVLDTQTFQISRQQDVLLRNFQTWALQHGKPYLNDAQESAKRFNIWARNVAYINSQNAKRTAAASAAGLGSSSAVRLGITAHTDLTREEFAARYLGKPMNGRTYTSIAQQQAATAHGPASVPGATSAAFASVFASLYRKFGFFSEDATAGTHMLNSVIRGKLQKLEHWRYENVTPPAAVDWRAAIPPILGPIKNQHVNGTPCGSCWAFSAVSIMEIASAAATGKVVSGSEQQLIDCDRKYDHGCSGGGWLNAIQYTIKHRGLAEEQQYPYIGKDGKCNKKVANAEHELQVDSWEDVPFSNETALAAAVSQTPVIVAICVGPALDDWHHYTGGIYDTPCCEKEEEITLDHGIVVVGYGQENGTPFWILKNSWGTSWGEHGFMRVRRNHGRHGKCALASYPAMVFRKPNPQHLDLIDTIAQ